MSNLEAGPSRSASIVDSGVRRSSCAFPALIAVERLLIGGLHEPL